MADEAKEMLDLLLLLWEACGIYRTDLTWMESTYETVPLTSVRSLTRFMSENPKIHGAGKIRRVLHYVRDRSASVRETQIALFLGLPIRYGGFNLGLPQMNHRVDASQEARLIGGRSHFRCDLCWPDQKIDIEYQSDESHEGKLMRIKDDFHGLARCQRHQQRSAKPSDSRTNRRACTSAPSKAIASRNTRNEYQATPSASTPRNRTGRSGIAIIASEIRHIHANALQRVLSFISPNVAHPRELEMETLLDSCHDTLFRTLVDPVLKGRRAVLRAESVKAWLPLLSPGLFSQSSRHRQPAFTDPASSLFSNVDKRGKNCI